MTTEVTPRRAATRAALLAAASSVIAEKGIAAANIEEICERANYTRGAFSSNFSTPDDLVMALLEDISDRLTAGAKAAAGLMGELDGLDTEASIEFLVRAFVDSQPKDVEQVLVMREIQLYAIRDERVRDRYTVLYDMLTPVLTEIIAQASLGLGLRIRVTPAAAIEFLHGMYDHASMQALLHPSESSQERLVAGLVRIVKLLIVEPTP